MRYIAYFTFPTLAGWVAGSLTCISTMSLLAKDWMGFRDVVNITATAGLFIIAPTFFLCILPYCGVALHTLRAAKFETRPKFHSLSLFLCLLVLGALLTFIPAAMMLGHKPSFSSTLPPENPILWFLPFLPYSAVVAGLSGKLFRHLQDHAD